MFCWVGTGQKYLGMNVIKNRKNDKKLTFDKLHNFLNNRLY